MFVIVCVRIKLMIELMFILSISYLYPPIYLIMYLYPILNIKWEFMFVMQYLSCIYLILKHLVANLL